MIELKNVRKSFGKKEAQVEALRGVTLTVKGKWPLSWARAARESPRC